MIEYDESEYCYSDFDDNTLRMIERLFGPEARCKLLIPPEKVNYVRSDHGHLSYTHEERPDPIIFGGGRFFNTQAAQNEAQDEEIPTLDIL